MANFHYTGRDCSGSLVSGEMGGTSADAVAADLYARSITPVDIQPGRPARGSGRRASGVSTVERINGFLAGPKVDIDQLIMFSRQMYSLTKAGLPLDRAITGLEGTMKNPAFRRVLKEVLRSLESGMTLSSALGRHPRIFSALFLSLINVGENTGQLDLAFRQVSRYLELEKDTHKKIKSATRYPTFVVVVIAAALAVITYFVIPAFSDTFDRLGAELPAETRILIAISDFVVAWWPHVLVSLGGSLFAFRAWKQGIKGRLRWDRYKLGFPLVGSIFERIALARFARTFSMVMRAGVPVVHGLSVVAGAIGNQHVAGQVVRMRDGISRGESLYHTAAQSQMFSPLVLQMMSVGEESGAIDDLMEEVADFYDAEVEYDLKRLSEAIEPILILFIAAMVLVLALGVFLPIWDLNTAVN